MNKLLKCWCGILLVGLLCTSLIGCSGEQPIPGPGSESVSIETPSVPEKPVDYTKFKIRCGIGPSMGGRPFDYQYTISHYYDKGGVFVGTVVPVEHRAYFEYACDANGNWEQEGHMEIVCDIVDVSDKYNCPSYQVGDQITVFQSTWPILQSTDPEERKAYMKDLGIPIDEATGKIALTAEEQELLDRGEVVYGKYLISNQVLNKYDFEMYLQNFAVLLLPNVKYDVVITSTHLDVRFKNNVFYAASQADMKEVYGEEVYRIISGGLPKEFMFLFKEFLSENRASLGLAPIEAEK